MELTRRDAVAALAAIGVGGGAVVYTQTRGGDGDEDRGDGGTNSDGTPGTADESDETLLATAAAVADVVYPSDVEGAGEFARTYVDGRVADDDAHRRGVADAVATLDARAEEAHGTPFRELDREAGDAVLAEMGMEAVDPDPDGTDRERVRYYLVNELLYGLLTSPKASALIGVENPPGHAGGLDAYQQGPQG